MSVCAVCVFLIQVIRLSYSSRSCRFRSKEPTSESAAKCVQAYAIRFAVHTIVLFCIFSVLMLRQELFWDSTIMGVICYILPNFWIAQTVIEYSTSQTLLSVALIAALLSLLLFTHWKVHVVRRLANRNEGCIVCFESLE